MLPVDLAVALVEELEQARVSRQLLARTIWKASWDEFPDYPQGHEYDPEKVLNPDWAASWGDSSSQLQQGCDDFGGVFNPDLGGEG